MQLIILIQFNACNFFGNLHVFINDRNQTLMLLIGGLRWAHVNNTYYIYHRVVVGKSAVPDSMYHNSSGTEYLCTCNRTFYSLYEVNYVHV